MSSNRRFSTAQRLVLAASYPASARKGVPELPAPPLDWREVVRLARAHHLVAQVAMAVLRSEPAAGDMEPAVREVFREAVDDAVHRDRMRVLVMAEMVGRCRASGIPVIPLKGVSLAERLYADPAARFGVDLDVLVRPDDVDAASGILSDMGYRALQPEVFRRRHFHIPFFHDSYRAARIVELHWDLTFADEPVRFRVETWWSRGKEVSLRYGSVLLPPEADEIAYLAHHATNRGRITLRDLQDLGRLLLPGDLPSRVREARESARLAGCARSLEATAHLVARCWKLAELLEAAPRPPGGPSCWLARHLLSPAGVVRSGADLWWPFRRIALGCLAGRNANGTAPKGDRRFPTLHDLPAPEQERARRGRSWLAMTVARAGCLLPAAAFLHLLERTRPRPE